MANLNQFFLNKTQRLRKYHKSRVKALRINPQKRGIVIKVKIESPKKPNSAKRKVIRGRLCTRKKIRVKIPGEGRTPIRKFTKIIVHGMHARDTPGVRYGIIRGKLDVAPVYRRRKSRSKYGVKREWLYKDPPDIIKPKRKKK